MPLFVLLLCHGFTESTDDCLPKAKHPGLISREFRFSPLEVYDGKRYDFFDVIGHRVITGLGLRMGEDKIEFKLGHLNDAMVVESDSISFLKYPFEKRVELHKNVPELEHEVFGDRFEDFLKLMFSQENKSDDMKKFCEAARKILEKSGIKH